MTMEMMVDYLKWTNFSWIININLTITFLINLLFMYKSQLLAL